MQRTKVFQVLLLELAGILLAHEAFAQSLLTCPVAVQLFYKAFGYRQVMGHAVFEVLNATCADVIMEDKSGKVLLALDTKIVRTEQGIPLTNVPPNSSWDPFNGGYVPVGSKFNIFVEARYTLWQSGWEINSFNFKGGQRVP